MKLYLTRVDVQIAVMPALRKACSYIASQALF
jgi:hypothetical protein